MSNHHDTHQPPRRPHREAVITFCGAAALFGTCDAVIYGLAQVYTAALIGLAAAIIFATLGALVLYLEHRQRTEPSPDPWPYPDDHAPTWPTWPHEVGAPE